MLGLGSVNGSYHFFSKKIVGNTAPFVGDGYTMFFGHFTGVLNGKNLTHGLNAGGGIDYFTTGHLGVRLEVRYFGHGGRILNEIYPTVNQFNFVAFRAALTFR